MPFSIPEVIADLPALMDLVQSIVALVDAEKKAVTFADKQKISEPVQEKLAALIDVVKAQAAS